MAANHDSNPNTTTEQSRVAYQVVVNGDSVTVFDEYGNIVLDQYMWLVFEALHEAKRQGRRIREDISARELNWTFPKKRSACFGVKQCVYAIMPTAREHTAKLPIELQAVWPNVIKIGYTATSLMVRRTALDNQFGGDLVVYAYAECEQPALAESGIHRFLSAGRVFGEWFHRDYVMGYISGGGR